jgi:hypothetical protein
MSKPLIKNPERLAFMRRESLRVGGWSPELKSYLAKHQLSLVTIVAHASWLNIALAKFLGSNSGEETFLFDADGELAAVIEAMLFDDCREQVTADLVAWPLNDPDAFVTAMGPNDGADILGPQWMVHRRGAPLMVHRTPLRWLQAGCEGCVLLKPGALHWLHKAGGPFIAEDLEHGRELRDLLGANAIRHRILVPEKARAA